jgi:protein O-mannosyl-transferase
LPITATPPMNSQPISRTNSPEIDATISARTEQYLVAAILAVTALVYCATMRFEFVYDDEGQIVQNALIRSWRFVPQYFQGNVWQYLFPDEPGNYYRPLNVLWFRLNDALFGLGPSGWHAFSVLLHVLATFLAYQVARRLTGRPFVAAATALVFGVHPMRHEVVGWVSGTTESLWSVLFLGALLAYLRSREDQHARWMALSCLLYGAALLSKETAIMLPAIIFAHAFIYDAPSATGQLDSWPQRIMRAAVLGFTYAPVAILYLIVRVMVLHGFSHPQLGISLGTVALTAPSIAFFYVKQWLLPIHMAEFYDLPLRANFDVVHVLLPAMALLILAIALWLLRSKLGSREVAFASVWMVVLLLPSFDVAVFPAGQLVHDRYFYLPSFGAALIVALALAKFAHGVPVHGVPQRWLLATLGLAVLLAYGTAMATRYWETDYSMFEHSYRVAPLNQYGRNGYAIQLAKHGDYEAAIPMLLQLLKEQPNTWLANYNYGRLNYDMGMLEPAERYLARAQGIDPRMPDTYLQLALVDMRFGRLDLAEGNIRQAVTLRPIEAGYRFALGAVLAQRGNCTEAVAQFHEAIDLQPGFPRAQEQIDRKCQPAAGQASGSPPARPPAISPAPANNPSPTTKATPVSVKPVVAKNQ